MASCRSRLAPRYTVYWSEPVKIPASRPGKLTSSRAPTVFTWQPADWYLAHTLRISSGFRGRSRLVPARPGTINGAVSYTHLRAHETDSYLVCRLLLEK